MSRRTLRPTLRISAGLLLAGGLLMADLPGQELPPPSAEAQRTRQNEGAPQRQDGRAGGHGLGVDVISTPRGVVVTDVRRESPAAKLGLRPGDEIVSFAGQQVSRAEEFLELLRQQRPESTVKAEVRRDGELVDMAIVLGSGENTQDREVAPPDRQQDRPQQQRQQRPQEQRRQFAPRDESLFDSPPQQRRREGAADRRGEQRQTTRYQPPGVWAGFILERAPLGVAIEQLHPQGPARQAGLRVGDRIVRVNGQVAVNPEEVYTAIEQRQPGDEIQLTVLRGEEMIEGSVRVEEPPPGLMEQPVGEAGGPDVSRLAEQQRQNTQMIRDLMQEVRMLRQELEDLRTGGNRRGSR